MTQNRKSTAEDFRLEEDARREKNWKRWGPYLADRHDVPLVCDAADGICQLLTSRLSGRRPSDRYFRTVTELGAAIADGGFKSITGLEAEEILMPYENE